MEGYLNIKDGMVVYADETLEQDIDDIEYGVETGFQRIDLKPQFLTLET